MGIPKADTIFFNVFSGPKALYLATCFIVPVFSVCLFLPVSVEFLKSNFTLYVGTFPDTEKYVYICSFNITNGLYM